LSIAKILVTTWGCPWNYDATLKRYSGFRWSEVEYVLDNNRLKSRTILPLLYDLIKPSKCIIIVLDTVAYKYYRDYNELINDVIGLYKDFIRDIGLDPRNVDIIVAPGAGYYSNGIFEGYIYDYKVYTAFEISYRIIDDIRENDVAELHLDLSHGVNYMPTLTYMVIRDLASILAVFKTVKLTVYNSEPYTSGAKKLTIHVIEKTDTFPWPRYSMVYDKKFFIRAKLQAEERKELDQRIKDIMKKIFESRGYRLREVNCFMASIQNGLPLALYRFYISYGVLYELLEHLIKLYKEYIIVKYANSKLHVAKRLGLGDSLYELVKAYITSALLTNIDRVHEPRIGLLNSVRENVFKRNYILNNMISRDLHSIMDRVTRYEKEHGFLTKWTPYDKIYGRGEYTFRDFVAHSGLLAKLIEVYKRDGKIYVRYKEKEIDKVIRFCEDILKP